MSVDRQTASSEREPAVAMRNRPVDSVMVNVVVRPVVASLQLMAAYVLVHGHYSPGGGFQSGVLLAAAVFLLDFVPRTERGGFLSVSERGAAILASAGVLGATVVGLVPMAYGSPFLDYAALPFGMEPAATRSLGILLFEVGITFAVMGVILSIFHSLNAEDVGP
jgi:multicomponent Na+:H+ antiporter subunit B